MDDVRMIDANALRKNCPNCGAEMDEKEAEHGQES